MTTKSSKEEMVEIIKSLRERGREGWGQGMYQVSSDSTQRLPGRCGPPERLHYRKEQDVVLCDHTLRVWLQPCWGWGWNDRKESS